MNKKDEISEIIMLGMSHKNAPVEVRERFCIPAEKVQQFQEEAHENAVEEIVYLSTCNRVEVYFTAKNVHITIEKIYKLLEKYTGLDREDFKDHLYKKYSRDVVYHLLFVASSLDSMVIGENEILTQIKQAYRDSVHHGHSGILLNRLFHQSFNTAKKVKTKTGISQSPVSIAYIAIELARKIFGKDLSDKKALLIGAGEMGELILKYCTKNNIHDITIANRSIHNAEKIVENINKETHIIPLDDIEEKIPEMDIVVTSVSSPKYIITPEMINNINGKREGNTLFIIDIAVPRNVDPAVTEIENVFLFNIDDLKKISEENLQNRIKEIDVAKQIVNTDATELLEWFEGLEIVPMITRIRQNFDEIREQEFQKYKRRKLKHLDEIDIEAVEELTKQIMSKILHNPIMAIKENKMARSEGYHDRESIREKTRIIEELFIKKK